MKQFLLLIFPFLIYTCNISNENKTIKDVTLENDVGVIKFVLSSEFDTFKKSYSQSDCGCCCAHFVYGFRSKNNDNLPLLDTIPYFNKIENTDSLKVFSFSIYQTACRDCNSAGFEINKEYLKSQENRLLQENIHTKIELKELRMINKHLFSIIGSTTNYSDYVIEDIEAVTIYNGETIAFNGQRRNLNNSEFIQDIYTMIKTIEFN